MPLHTIQRKNLAPYLSGQNLLGDDATEAELAAWFAEEANGYANLVAEDANIRTRIELAAALNTRHFGTFFQGKTHLTGLIFGPANASEIQRIEPQFNRWYAIEPGKVFHNPAYYQSPVTFLPVTPQGNIDLPDASVDVVFCMSVLHHIANVSFVMSEITRVLKPGGTLFLREPTVTMGNWHGPRPGLTANERGLPLAWLHILCTSCGLTITRSSPAVFAPLEVLVRKLGLQLPYAHTWYVQIDALLCTLTRPLYRYWRPHLYQRFAPAAVLIVAHKA